MPSQEDTVPTRAEIEAILEDVTKKTKKQGKKARNDERKTEVHKKFEGRLNKKIFDQIDSDLASYQYWEKDEVHPAREV